MVPIKEEFLESYDEPLKNRVFVEFRSVIEFSQLKHIFCCIYGIILELLEKHLKDDLLTIKVSYLKIK